MIRNLSHDEELSCFGLYFTGLKLFHVQLKLVNHLNAEEMAVLRNILELEENSRIPVWYKDIYVGNDKPKADIEKFLEEVRRFIAFYVVFQEEFKDARLSGDWAQMKRNKVLKDCQDELQQALKKGLPELLAHGKWGHVNPYEPIQKVRQLWWLNP